MAEIYVHAYNSVSDIPSHVLVVRWPKFQHPVAHLGRYSAVLWPMVR